MALRCVFQALAFFMFCFVYRQDNEINKVLLESFCIGLYNYTVCLRKTTIVVEKFGCKLYHFVICYSPGIIFRSSSLVLLYRYNNSGSQQHGSCVRKQWITPVALHTAFSHLLMVFLLTINGLQLNPGPVVANSQVMANGFFHFGFTSQLTLNSDLIC